MIYIGADHGGFKLKEQIKKWLTEWKYKYEDSGAFTFDAEDDYPVYALTLGEKVGREDNPTLPWEKRSKGILICRSAGGVIIAANKVKNVRAVAAMNETQAKHARQHNDANVIGISGDWSKEEEVKQIVKTFLTTEFSKEKRHVRRLDQIASYEFESAGCGGGEGGCGGSGGCSCA